MYFVLSLSFQKHNLYYVDAAFNLGNTFINKPMYKPMYVLYVKLCILIWLYIIYIWI